MKTICPHCSQDYEVADSLLNRELICSVCNKRFFSQPALICPECSKVNHSLAVRCILCHRHLSGNSGVPSPQPPTLREMKNAYERDGERSSFLVGLSEWFHEVCRRFREIDIMCPHCGQHYQMPAGSEGNLVVCSNCNKKFNVLKGRSCPLCHAWNTLGAVYCTGCKVELNEFNYTGRYLDESPVKQVFFWPVAILTLLWAYFGHMLAQFFFMDFSNTLLAGVFSFFSYYLILFGLIFCCRILSGKFLKLLQWPFGVNLFLTSAVLIYFTLIMVCSSPLAALLPLPIVALSLWLHSFPCKLCNPVFPVKKVILAGLAAGVLGVIVVGIALITMR